MSITSEVSSVIQNSKEQFEKDMITSLTVNTLKNIVLRSVPAEDSEMERINDPKFRESFNRILNPITANIIDRFQSVGKFDTGNLFTSMVTSISDSVSLESAYRAESLESKFLLDKIPVTSSREWVGEVKRTFESLKFSNEDIKKQFNQDITHILSIEAGKKIIDGIKDEVKKSIDETEAKNELVEGTLQEIADYKKEVAPPDDEYLDADNPDDKAKNDSTGEDEEGEAEGDEENLDEDTGEVSEEDGGEEEGSSEEDEDDDLDDDLEGEGDDLEDDSDLEDGGETGDLDDTSGGSPDPGPEPGPTPEPGAEPEPAVETSVDTKGKQANVIININAGGESSNPTQSSEGFGFKKSKKVYDSKEELLKSPELKIAVSNFKKKINGSGGKLALPTKEEYQKIFKKYEEQINLKQTKDFMTNLLIIDGVCLTVADMAWKGKVTSVLFFLIPFAGLKLHDKALQREKKKNIAKGIRYIQIGAPYKIIGKGKGGRDLYKGKNITGSVAYSTGGKSSESFTAPALNSAKEGLLLHTAESFASTFIPIGEREFNDFSLPDVKVMASEGVNAAVGDIGKEVTIRLEGAKYSIDKGSASTEDKKVLYEKLEKLETLSKEALFAADTWGKSMYKLGITQNGLLNSTESTLFVARNIISRFLTKTRVPSPNPLPYTSQENILANAFDIVQLRQNLKRQENPLKGAVDDLISSENVFYRNVVSIDDKETKEKATAVIDLADMVFKKALTANFITDYKIKSWEQNVGKDQKDTNAEVVSRVEKKFENLWQRPLNKDEKAIVSATTNMEDVTEIIPTPYEKFLIKLSKESMFDKSVEHSEPISPLSPEEKKDNQFKAKIFTAFFKSLEQFNLIDKYDFLEMDKFYNSTNLDLLTVGKKSIEGLSESFGMESFSIDASYNKQEAINSFFEKNAADIKKFINETLAKHKEFSAVTQNDFNKNEKLKKYLTTLVESDKRVNGSIDDNHYIIGDCWKDFVPGAYGFVALSFKRNFKFKYYDFYFVNRVGIFLKRNDGKSGFFTAPGKIVATQIASTTLSNVDFGELSEK